MKKRILSTLLALSMVFSLVGAGSLSFAAEETVIDLYGIGDFGGALDDSGKPTGNPGGARVVGAMKALTAESPNPIVVTGGTIYTGSAISETNHGKPVNEMLKAMGVKYASVGNHDFDWSNIDTREEVFSTWEEQGGFTFLNANVYYTEGEKAGQRVFTPYAVEEVAGVKIGFFGVIGEDNMSAISAINTQGIEFRPATAEAIEVAKLLRTEEKCDLVIALAHVASVQEAPYDLDAQVAGGMPAFIQDVNAACKAAGVKGLDGVMGSQTTAPCQAVIDGTPVVKAKNYGQFIDQLHIVIAADGTVTVTPSLHPLTQVTMKEGEETVSLFDTTETTRESIPEDADFKAVYDQYNAVLSELMDATRGTSDADFSYNEGADRFAYQKWYLRQNWYYVNYVYGEPIVAYMQNTGGIRNIGATVVKEGDPINLRLLYTVAPFDNYIVTMDMTGKDIKTLLEGKSQYGTYTSLLQYGLDVTYKEGEFEANGELESVKWNGEELKDDETYHIACNTFLYPGPGDSMDFSAGTNAKNINVINRNAVLSALLHQSAKPKDIIVNGESLEGYDPDVHQYTMFLPYDVDYEALILNTVVDHPGATTVKSNFEPQVGCNDFQVYAYSVYTDPYAANPYVENVYHINMVRGYADEASIPAEALEAVKAATAKGLFHGDEAGKFNPDKQLTLDELAVVLARAAGATDEALAAADTTLIHGESAAWAAPSVAWLIQNGVWTDGATADDAYLGFALLDVEGLTDTLNDLTAYLGVENVDLSGYAADALFTRVQLAAVLAQLGI